MRATLLVELLTEELPPKSLARLAQAFADEIFNGLVEHQLKLRDFAGRKVFGTPRRLATLIPEVQDQADDREMEVQGPPVKAPAAAIAGFAKKQGVDVTALQERNTAKGIVFVARTTVKGVALDAVLAHILADSIKKLPIARTMRWGSGEAQFVRPVHGLVMLHGERIVPGTVLGVASGNRSAGHRFMGKQDIVIPSAERYEATLRDEGKVIADFAARRADIAEQLAREAARHNATLGEHEALLEEVTALVEHPSVYVAGFEPRYLEVPQECLILTMRQNQKYFPLFDAAGKLLPKFLIVSNMQVADPRNIIGGNERVVRPRLEDARFFYAQDRKTRLEERVPQLAKVVYHGKLGTQLERVERIQLGAGRIARRLKADAALAERAAWLSKADLLTAMVGEFPELQGVMGRYYALHDGEPREVADAIEAHYRPRFSGDGLPESVVSCAVALAEKLDALAGLFAIGQVPTGEKDPFALRRAALGLIRILVEKNLELSLFDLVDGALAGFAGRSGIADAHADLAAFIFERARGYFAERGYSASEIESVLCLNPPRLDLIPKQLEAVRAFWALPEAESLAAANKRIGNILKQAVNVPSQFDASLMTEPEERALATKFHSVQPGFNDAFRELDFTAALKTLASLKAPVDAFFDKVMVMDKDPKVRANRIGLLGTLHGTMNRIADLSKLAK